MTEAIAVLALAFLFVLFAMVMRTRQEQSGAHDCVAAEGTHGCGGCSQQAICAEAENA